MTSRADNHAFPGLNVEGLALARSRNAENPSRKLAFSNDTGHAVPQQDLHAKLSCARFQRPHEGSSISSIGSHGTRSLVLHNRLRSLDVLGTPIGTDRRPVGKVHSVFFQQY